MRNPPFFNAFNDFNEALRAISTHFTSSTLQPTPLHLFYQTKWQVVQMADYGVPQSRRRLVLFAGLGFDIPIPENTHAKNPSPKLKLKKWLTLRDAIDNQPSPVTLSKALQHGGPQKYNWHVVRDIQPQVAARLDAAIPGKTWLEKRKPCGPSVIAEVMVGSRILTAECPGNRLRLR